MSRKTRKSYTLDHIPTDQLLKFYKKTKRELDAILKESHWDKLQFANETGEWSTKSWGITKTNYNAYVSKINKHTMILDAYLREYPEFCI